MLPLRYGVRSKPHSLAGTCRRSASIGDGLAEFERKPIGGHALITDPELLSSLAQAGALTLAEIYAVPEASS